MNNCIKTVEYEETMEGFDCAICLEPFYEEKES